LFYWQFLDLFGERLIATLSLFLRTMFARAYPRIIGMRRQPSWVIHEAILPILSVASFAFVYRAMKAPEEYVGFVILGGAMTAFWLNVLWSMGAQLYWERSSGNLELYIMAPGQMMAVLAGMALGGMILTCVRATVIMGVGILIFQVPFAPTSWSLLIFTFLLTLLALYGLGMMFASVFLLWGREAWHIVNLLQEPVFLLTGMNFPLKVFPTLLASFAAIIPLTAGMDAMRQLLFNAEGFWPLWIEIAILGVLAILFIALAERLLAYLERKSREEGRLTVKWQ
jgi:ABC-2 type transport system permease protein